MPGTDLDEFYYDHIATTPNKYKEQGAAYKISETNTAVGVKAKKTTPSLQNVNQQGASPKKPAETYLPKPKEKTCKELKQDFFMSKSCFNACRSGNGGNVGRACSHCRNMKKPQC